VRDLEGAHLPVLRLARITKHTSRMKSFLPNASAFLIKHLLGEETPYDTWFTCLCHVRDHPVVLTLDQRIVAHDASMAYGRICSVADLTYAEECSAAAAGRYK